MSFYKIAPADIVVIHDELDLRPGKVRVKRGGGAAGHNGLRSIDAMIGADYWRVRIGIGHPGIKELVHPMCCRTFRPTRCRRGSSRWSTWSPTRSHCCSTARPRRL